MRGEGGDTANGTSWACRQGMNVSLTPPSPLVIFVTRNVWGVHGEMNAHFYVRQPQRETCAPTGSQPDA